MKFEQIMNKIFTKTNSFKNIEIMALHTLEEAKTSKNDVFDTFEESWNHEKFSNFDNFLPINQ